ncbi:SIR2 family protein [Leptotrichia sp. oral taxon 879]|uniref:SIR2 family protein n=1 Tax=Leptotrichia sp. oral taxon 879 TaxID=1227267 RepID=UPI0003AE6775|nr:SIR2 family protein [Leptotrichia sp. oral taxon 879]ERK55006.1 transcriptional regulator, Sir2 family [Leptotrichia sp. oral taxon 879 str. F0557]
MGFEEWGVGEFGIEKGEKVLEQDIRFLAEELEKGKLVVFVGAGVSKNSGLPDWKELIKDYAEYRGIKEFTSKEYLTIPEEVFERYGSLKYYEIAEKRFLGKYVPNSVHRILKKMDLTYIITTNYDTLIEDEIKNLQVVSKDEDLPYTSSNKMLIKMHGDFKNKNIVLKKSDYDNYEKNFQLISTLIKGLFTTNTILFIGYSYNDTNVQQIMNWIKEILKEETRKAFLVEFTEKDDKEEENGEQINRISLKLLTKNNDEILYADKKGRVDYDYEKTLTEFLLNIYNEKENVRQEKNFEIYKNLNYLTKHNWKKLDKFSEIYIDKDWKRILNTKLEFKDIEKYEEILFKSRIKKVVQNINRSEKEILIPFSEKGITPKRKEQKNILEEKIEVEEKFLKIIFDYDYENFQNLVEEYKENNNINKYVIVYGYLFFKKINKAKEIIKSMIEEKENFNSKNEKLVWDNFILSIIGFIEITHTEENLNKTFESIEESLEDKYFEYFKYETELFNEIFEYSTLEAINKEINRLFDKVRKEKRTSYVGGTPPLYKAMILSRDLFYFCSLNGIFGNSFSPYSEFMKKYIEILLMSYTTNKNVEVKNQMFKNRNLLEEFEYFDFFMMLELSYSDLKKLFNEYMIKDLKCKEEILDRLIVLLKNIFDWIEENDEEFMQKIDTLESILLIISKLDLMESQFQKLVDIILNDKNSNIFFENNYVLGIVDNFRIIIYKNFQNLNKEFFDKVLEKIFSIDRNRIDKNLLDYITYYFEEKEIPKISKNDRIENFINKNNLKIKGYFLRVIDETYFEELKNEILKEIKETLDIESYSFLLNQKFIDFIPETEDKILEELDRIFQKKDIDINNLISYTSEKEKIFYFLLESGLNNRLPISFIEKLKNYKNKEFFKSLEQYESEILWKYILNQENFDYSEFTENELEKFSKIRIKNLLEKDNKKLIKLVREYIFSKIKNNDNISNNSIVEAYFEWESEKNEATE